MPARNKLYLQYSYRVRHVLLVKLIYYTLQTLKMNSPAFATERLGNFFQQSCQSDLPIIISKHGYFL